MRIGRHTTGKEGKEHQKKRRAKNLNIEEMINNVLSNADKLLLLFSSES
jgi:hypothetical protein